MGWGRQEGRMRRWGCPQGPESEAQPYSLKTNPNFSNGEPGRLPGGGWYEQHLPTNFNFTKPCSLSKQCGSRVSLWRSKEAPPRLPWSTVCARHRARPRRVRTRRESICRWGSRGSVRLAVKVRVEGVRTGTPVCLTPNIPSSARSRGVGG